MGDMTNANQKEKAAKIKRKPKRESVLQHTFAAARRNRTNPEWTESRPPGSGLLQRRCACGKHTIAGGECPECRSKRESTLQRTAINAMPDRTMPGNLSEIETPSELGFNRDLSHAPAHTASTQTIQPKGQGLMFLKLSQMAQRKSPDDETTGDPNSPEAIEKRLADNDITIRSSGNCRDRTKKNCTSVEGMRKATVDGIIAFRHACGQPLIMTGGTEVGHAGGAHSHAKGYKVDIALDDAVTKYIKDNYTYKGKRKGDGASLYKDSKGNIFALESNHWDITFL